MAANYDSIASSYDFLSRLVFGQAQIDAQVDLLRFIPPDSRVLIVGGGTGWILESIAELHPHGLTVDYIESSEQMISLSQKRNCKDNKVNFIPISIEYANLPKDYDVIITPFLFDNFKGYTIDMVFRRIDAALKPGGLFLYTDFVPQNQTFLWQRLLLAVMYLFFRLVSSVDAIQMADMGPYFASGYSVVYETSRYVGFIRSAAYRKL
jgi:ubiquinone/menaquinone biosynthesis C-methylase UbiE